MSRIGMKRKNTENGLATSEAKPTNSSNANGNKVVKRGRPRKHIEDVLLSVPDTNEKTDSVEVPASRTRNNVKENRIKNMEVEDSTNTKGNAESGTKSDEINSVPNIKKRGRKKKNHPEHLHTTVEENEVNVAPNLINDKKIAVEKSQSVLQNGTAFPDNISVIHVNEENKALKPNKRGRKKKLGENAAIENVKMVSSTPKTHEVAVVKKIPVKRGRKNFKATEGTASGNTESVKVATNKNEDSDANGHENAEYKTESEVSEKHGSKNIISLPKEENLSSTTENASSEIKVEADGSSKKHNVPELLHEPSNQENCKESKILGTKIKANEFFEESAVDKKKNKKDEKTNPAINLKKCSVILERNEITENALQKVNSVSHETKPDKAKAINTKLANNGDKGESSKGNNKREKDGSEDDFKPTKPSKVPKKATKSSESKNIAKTPDIEMLDFSNKSINSSGKPWNCKISSWNINGVRAWLEKDGISYITHEKPDVIALQETKCSDDKLPDEVTKIDGYHCYWVAGDKEGYSGVGLLSKQEPVEVKYGIGVDLHDNEGRVITAEYEKFFVVAAYVPNAGRGLIRLEYRTEWDKDFRSYLTKLDEKKPVILCGDLNVAHEEVDLANPKTNKKNAGFTKEEREGFSTLLKEGFLDTFRHLYPDAKGAYTFWTYMMNARAKNVGWRLDYFVISERFVDCLCDSIIRKEIYGSDHCPITLFLAL